MEEQDIHCFVQKIKDSPFAWEEINKEEIESYLNMKPTIWQKILWVFFPTIGSFRYYFCQSLYKEMKDRI